MAPTDKHKIEFIAYLQRLLQEGDFSSTYKFALLHAIADICVEKDTMLGLTFLIGFDELVDKFLNIYWQHAKPFIVSKSKGLNGGVLQQNAGRQAKIISDIIELQSYGASNVEQAKQTAPWAKVYSNTLQTIKNGPLWRLQILSKSESCFLYPHNKDRDFIELNIGVADSFRQFHDLVVQFARQGWIKKIAQIGANKAVIGNVGDVSEFLFNSNRASLKPAADLMRDIQKNRCFYCDKVLHENGDVDHFIPFSRYNNDLSHNFVLAHKVCNNNKRDYLAAPKHRDKWIEQNLEINTDVISNELGTYYISDVTRAKYVAKWAYTIARTNKNKFWLANKDIFISN